MATATKPSRVARLRAARNNGGGEYAAAIGMIDAVLRYPETYDHGDPVAEIRQILAALNEVTGYDRD